MNRTRGKKLLYRLSKPVSFKLLQQLSNQFFVFPFYHLISDAPSPLVKHLYPVSDLGQFIKDLDFLQRNFSPATFDEVLNLANSKKYHGKPKFFLTFDDGLSECFDVVLPVLRERNLPAAFFVNPAYVGNRQLSHRQKVSLIIDHVINENNQNLLKLAEESIGMRFHQKDSLIKFIKRLTFNKLQIIDNLAAGFEIDYKDALKAYRPYMDISQLQALHNSGFIIGSHSYDHPEFNLLSEDNMKVQVVRSFQFLEEEMGVRERIFSFPFHDIGIPLSFFDFLKNEAGVKASFGTSGIKLDNAPGHIHRIPMELKGFSGAEEIIRSEYFYYLGKAIARKNLVKRR